MWWKIALLLAHAWNSMICTGAKQPFPGPVGAAAEGVCTIAGEGPGAACSGAGHQGNILQCATARDGRHARQHRPNA